MSVQFDALGASRFEPIHYKVHKLLEEERFHFEHARGWTARLTATDAGRDVMREAFEPVWVSCLRWFGPADDPLGAVLSNAGITDASPDELRQRWLDRVGPVVHEVGLGLAEPAGDGWSSIVAPECTYSSRPACSGGHSTTGVSLPSRSTETVPPPLGSSRFISRPINR